MMEWIARYWLQALFGLVLAALGAGYRQLAKRFREYKVEEKALSSGLQALLRDRIIQAYNYYVHQKGACPMYGMDNILAMYEAYHALGGNGTVDKLVEDLQNLPTEKGGKTDGTLEYDGDRRHTG